MATAPMAPPVIREPVMRLADRLDSAVPVPEALRVSRSEVDDRSCDMVVCALLLAATSRAETGRPARRAVGVDPRRGGHAAPGRGEQGFG